MSAFTRFRQLAWAALVIAPGFVATACTPVTHVTAVKPSGPAGLATAQVGSVAAQPPQSPAPVEAAQARWPWPFRDDDDALREIEDEFEGGGWSFWPS